ncbi:peptidase C39 (plasmid) [Neorhizobium galegae]|nr:peptidase C39 [Neorhizobium galegae]
MKVQISYNQREDSQPANFSFFNIGPKWTIDWLSYVIDDPTNPGANVSRYMSGGGAFYYLDYDARTKRFAAQDDDGSVLALTSQAPATYRRTMADGRTEVYAESDGSTAYPRNIFLSKVIDPQGNAATLHYDGQKRLVSITDAVGRDTTFSYDQPGKPLLITKITDPFGRGAKITYDAVGRLKSITDIIGLTSSFTYDANSLVNSLTTPYGTTNFAYTAPGAVTPRFVQATDPLGYKEREEWLEPSPTPASDPVGTVPTGMPLPPVNGYLIYRNSFHWDKLAYAAAGCTDTGGCDYSKARVRHFVHMPGVPIKGTAIESTKEALENRVWYNYPGQESATGSLYGGTFSQPIAVGRVLDDGTTQISRYEYDTDNFFKLTKAVDPVGRTTTYAYSNGIDLISVSQETEFGEQAVLAQYVYNNRHRPLFYKDASGQSYTYTYNITGQITSVTNPFGQKTSYQYDASGNLTAVTNANSVVSESYTYDSFARIRTFTDSEGWTVTADYDAADRLTQLSYLDGTSERFAYDNLDLASYRDREGRTWSYEHDADHRLVKFTHPSGDVVRLGYNGQNLVTSLIDPSGNETKWSYDVQGRASGKEYANGSQEVYAYEQTISRLRSVTDALNQTKQSAYAADNRLLTTSYIDAVNTTPNVASTHDPFYPRIETMTDGTGTTNYNYVDPFSNGALALQQECFIAMGQSACNHTIDYAYDDLARLSSRTIQGSGPEALSYDAINRVTRHTSDLGAFNISYLGQTSQITRSKLDVPGANLETTWSYLNNLGDRRLSAISNKGLTAGQFTDFAITTSPENLITSISQNSDASVEVPDPPSLTASFNELNEITSVSGQAFTYDANGNLLSDGTRTYSWDAENRLIGVTFANVSDRLVTYSYDGMGRRTSIRDGSGGGEGTVRKFVWCGNILCQARDGGYLVQRSYVEEGEIIVGGTSELMFYGIDQIGSVRRVYKSATEAPAIDYDPYGARLQSNASGVDFGFAKMFANDPGQNYLTLYRAYDPKNGRWLSRDPVGEFSRTLENTQYTKTVAGLNLTNLVKEFPRLSPNLYSYVDGNPLSYVDPNGDALRDYERIIRICTWLITGKVPPSPPTGPRPEPPVIVQPVRPSAPSSPPYK